MVPCAWELKRGTGTDSRSFGKPPPESFARTQKTDFMRQVLPMTPGLGKPAYLKLCPEMKVLHRACCHSKGQLLEAVQGSDSTERADKVRWILQSKD